MNSAVLPQSHNLIRLSIGRLSRTSLSTPLSCIFFERCQTPRFAIARSFRQSANLDKKAGRLKQSTKVETSPAFTPPQDPLDLADLDDGLKVAHERLKEELSKLRPGGKLDREDIESLRVKLDKSNNKSELLGDLAQVIPRGRTLNVIVGEKEHVKAVSSAIQSSDLSITPQADPHNPQQLNVQIPPPTTESRQAVLKTADAALQAAYAAIRGVKSQTQKRHKAMQQDKRARPDDVRRVADKMDKAVGKANDEAKKIVESAKKALQNA